MTGKEFIIVQIFESDLNEASVLINHLIISNSSTFQDFKSIEIF